jgi:hypothetical protein
MRAMRMHAGERPARASRRRFLARRAEVTADIGVRDSDPESVVASAA